MKHFDAQAIEINVEASTAFAYIADPTLLPEWTEAFTSVAGGEAQMKTPNGEVRADLEVEASPVSGTIDWKMTFPDGSVATAYSRVVDVAPDRCVYSFVLTPPPAPLEALEGAMQEQSQTLARELMCLKRILEASD